MDLKPDEAQSTPSFAPEVSDEELAERYAKRGDRAALDKLVCRLQDFAYRIAICKCPTLEIGEEVAQEALLRLFRLDWRFENRGPGSFKDWFYSVITRTAQNRLRSERRTMRRALHPRYVEGARQKAAQAERSTATTLEMESALKSLDEAQRLPIVLHYLQGLPQADIGRMLGISQGLVSRRITEGLESLRRQMARSGAAISAAALPMMLKESNLFQAPASFRTSLNGLSRLSAESTTSSRVRTGIPRYSWLTVAAVALAATGLSIWRPWNAPPAVPITPVASTAAAKETLANEPSDSRTFVWTFDQELGPGILRRADVVSNATQKTWAFPEWSSGIGKNGSGGVRFGKDGASLFVGPIPARRLPAWLDFEAHAEDSKTCAALIQVEFGPNLKPQSEVGAKKSGLTLSSKTTEYYWKWSPWSALLDRKDPNDPVEFVMTFSGRPAGGWAEKTADPFWSSHEGVVYFEVRGTGFVMDNLRMGFGTSPQDARAATP